MPPQRFGPDLSVGQLSDGEYVEVLVSTLRSKGFCTIDLNLDLELLGRANSEVEELRNARKFTTPPSLIADGLLGPEGSAKILELPSQKRSEEASTGLQQLDRMIDSIGVSLGPHTDDLGFALSSRTNALLHETSIPEEGPPLAEKDVMKWLEKFVRHTVMVLIFLGPMEGGLTLKVHGEEEAEAHEVPTSAGTMVVLRPDVLSHQHTSLGKACAMSSFFVDRREFQKNHPTGGFLMCPAAKELDAWAMQRARQLKITTDDQNDLDPAIPREFQRAMNHSFYTGNMVGIRALAAKTPGFFDCQKLFQALTAGPDLVSRVPLARWEHHNYYDPDPECWRYGKTYCQHGGFMEGVDLFDNKAFNLSPAESKGMDPHQRHIMEVGYESLIRMGMKKNNLMNSSGSVYVGHSFGEFQFAERSGDAGGGPTGGAGCVAANRLSFVLGMKGPSMALDTDQSSSLSALFLADESVQKKGRGVTSDFAVGIGAQMMMSPVWWSQYCAMGWLTTRGRCLTYDRCATGFVRGDTFASLALKPLADVVDGRLVRDDRFPVVGVLAGISLNTNGRGASLGAPSGQCEQEVMADTIRCAGIAGKEVDCVEAHGSGMPISDVIEVSSLSRSLNHEDGTALTISSLKTVMGNTMESGGIASLLKNVLGIQFGVMTSGLHLRELNDHLDVWDDCVHLVSELLPYARRTAFAATLSRGYGGTNVSCINWGTLDVDRLKPLPVPAEDRIYFWPSGGGFLESKDRPEKGYHIVGSWTEWVPEAMEEEGTGLYGFTVQLGENCWEQFQILLDGDPEKVLHPGTAVASKDTAVYGPEEGMLAASNWMIDGRCAWPPQAIEAMKGEEADGQVVLVQSPDIGRPGDKYRVNLRIAGKWRIVTWKKEPQDRPGEIKCVGKYYIVASWNHWDFQELTPDPERNGHYSLEVTLPWGLGEFQIVRNRDLQQVFFPGQPHGDSSEPVEGPAEGGFGYNWRIQGRPNENFRIEFSRSWSDGEDLKKVSWERAKK